MANPETTRIREHAHRVLQDWLESCTRRGKVSRNTLAMGLVVLDHLRRNCPVNREGVISRGGEVSGARSGLKNILANYGLPPTFLKEATTRQGHQDGQRLFEKLDWGAPLARLSEEERQDLLRELVGELRGRANDWLNRQNLKLALDRRQAPTTWIEVIVEAARGRSRGIVEQQLVGAKLARRFPDRSISNHPTHAGDQQTERAGDFVVAPLIYHVTAAPSLEVIGKCARNIAAGLQPILLVPHEQENKAHILAEEKGIDKQLAIASIENFVALNIIELAIEEDKDLFGVLQEIVEIYNRRLMEVETDLSLKIEVQ